MKRLAFVLILIIAGGAAHALTATMDKAALSAALDKVDARTREFNDLYARCRAHKIRLDYPTVAKTTLDQFIPLARQDVETGEERRTEFAIKDFNRTLNQSIAEMKAYLANPDLAPDARRYQTGSVAIDGLSLIGGRKTATGKQDRGPVFFCGYGHFSGVRNDMTRWPGYGVNIIQFSEFGPSAVLPEEDKIDLKPVETLIQALDDAAKHNVRVDFLLSPHYFPDWAMKKWPQIGCGGGGFFGFFVDAPEAKQVIEKFLRIVMPMIKDKPALNSFCLSNEPNLENTASCPATKTAWVAYLTKTHGDVATMNERYGTEFPSFADVPLPGLQAFNDPQYYDWCYFNEQRFAAWHAWMADICHELAPKIPVHAKIQMHNTLFRDIISYGVSPEMIGAATDYNGNDCIFVDNPGVGWAAPWMVQNVCYDIQRSLNCKPIFNSENHPTLDGSTAYYPPEHFRTCLWLGALRGQSATTIWVWERMTPGAAWSYPFYGNVMDRPGCAEAVGRTCLDLNRFADEMAALQRVKSPVAILFSVASIAKQADYLSNMEWAYTALNFCGIKVDFISEKQLAEKSRPVDYRMIVLPDATHVLDSTVEALARLPESVRLVNIGDSLSRDQYNRPRKSDAIDAVRTRSLAFKAWSDPEKVLWPALYAELDRLKALPPVRLIDTATGGPAWGVEWLPAKIGGRSVISILDLRSDRKNVELQVDGRRIEAKDLLSIGGRAKVGLLAPMVPVLAEY